MKVWKILSSQKKKKWLEGETKEQNPELINRKKLQW